jgi:hypothetical protein
VDDWLLRPGRLGLRDADGNRLRLAGAALVRGGDVLPIPRPCPRERADELAAVRSWLLHNPARVERADRPPAEPVEGGAALHRLLTRLRSADRTREGAH